MVFFSIRASCLEAEVCSENSFVYCDFVFCFLFRCYRYEFIASFSPLSRCKVNVFVKPQCYQLNEMRGLTSLEFMVTLESTKNHIHCDLTYLEVHR